MISRIAKQKMQDSDRQDDPSGKSERKEVGTNQSLQRDAQVPKKTSVPGAVKSDAGIEARKLCASSQQKKTVDLGSTDHHHSSHFFYYPHYSQPSYYRNQSCRYPRPYYQPSSYPLPPSKPFQATNKNEDGDDMAPFDDTTLATSNVSKKRKTGHLKIDTNPAIHNGMKHRERSTRPYSPPYYPPPSFGGEYYPPHPSPYHHPDDARSPHGHHFEFFDIDSPRDFEYPYSTTPIAIDTPLRSNMTPRAEVRDRSEQRPEEYDEPVPPPPPHKVRRQPYPPPYPPRNGWRAPYQRPKEFFSREEPYDRHFFSPSPPPPPPFPDDYVTSSVSFSPRAASPSMSWYEGSQGGSFDEPIRPPPPHYYSHPHGGYHYPHPPPHGIQENQRPVTPSSKQSIKNIPTVTPGEPNGRISPCPSNRHVETAPVPVPSKTTIATPNDRNSASTFAPSSPFGTLGDDDIVCGRGAPVNHHIGNERFRQLVLDYNKSYFVAKRSEKPKIAMKVLDVLASRGARFVRKIKGASSVKAHWEEVAHKIAYEKVCQALRDAGGPSVKEMLASPSKRKATSPMRENASSNKRQRLAYGGATRSGEEGKENSASDHY